MQNICKNCKHYFSPKKASVPYGHCGASILLPHWIELYESSQAMKPGFFGGENIVVSETFGCVNFKFKTDIK